MVNIPTVTTATLSRRRSSFTDVVCDVVVGGAESVVTLSRTKV